MKQLLALLTSLALTLLPVWASAQPGLPSDPQQAPLGGLEILAVIGGSYAIKKLRERW